MNEPFNKNMGIGYGGKMVQDRELTPLQLNLFE